MDDTFKVLTRKHEKGSHYPTELTINWEGCTEEDLRTIARHALIHEFQARQFKREGPIPEKETIVAKAWVDKTPVMHCKYTPPPPKANKAMIELENALALLSREEVKALFAGEGK